MRFDEKTGEKKAENRTDEIKISLEQMYKLQKKTEGLLDKDFENSIMLKDISVSLGLLVDICGVILRKISGGDVCIKEESSVNDDERT